jgi:hypothetical protein
MLKKIFFSFIFINYMYSMKEKYNENNTNNTGDSSSSSPLIKAAQKINVNKNPLFKNNQ